MLHESLRLYVILKGMKWAHLPVAGGYYDQHPKFLDDMYTVMGVEARWRAKEEAKQRRQQRQQSSKGRRP